MVLYVKNLSKYWAYFTALTRPFKKFGRSVCSEKVKPKSILYNNREAATTPRETERPADEEFSAMRYLFVAWCPYFSCDWALNNAYPSPDLKIDCSTFTR